MTLGLFQPVSESIDGRATELQKRHLEVHKLLRKVYL